MIPKINQNVLEHGKNDNEHIAKVLLLTNE